MTNYLISCFSGARNMGDELILKCLINQIPKSDGEGEIYVTSLNPSYTESIIEDNINAVEWKGLGITKKAILNLRKLKNTIRKVDYVIIGGGGLLQDVHSVETIPRYLITAVLAKLYKKKVIYYSLGIGPIKNKNLRKLVKNISNGFVDYISVRDKKSKEYLVNLGVKTKIDITSDPVFNISTYIPLEKKNTGLRTVGVCFRQFKTSADTEKEIKLLIKELKIQKKKIVLFPLDYDEDIKLCERLAKEYKDIDVVKEYRTIEDLVQPMSQLDFMISMRLHGVIISASYGVPSVAVSYDPKVTNMQSKIGMNDYLINIEDFTAEQCLEKVESIENNYFKLQDKIKKEVSKEKRALDNFYDLDLTTELNSNKEVSKAKALVYIFKLFVPQIKNKIFR